MLKEDREWLDNHIYNSNVDAARTFAKNTDDREEFYNTWQFYCAGEPPEYVWQIYEECRAEIEGRLIEGEIINGNTN